MMSGWYPEDTFTQDKFKQESRDLMERLTACSTLEAARKCLCDWTVGKEFDADGSSGVRVRDCARALLGMIKPLSERKAGISMTQVLWDLACGRSRPDLQVGFFAEMIHLVQGIEGRAPVRAPEATRLTKEMTGREASTVRSDELDDIWKAASEKMRSYEDGLGEAAVARRKRRADEILKVLGAKPGDWNDWKWHVAKPLTDPDSIVSVISLSEPEREIISRARACNLPVGVTPYYASLMDDEATSRDRAIRAQVLPPSSYVSEMEKHSEDRKDAFDFMGEHATSPIDLVTRRYPAILILKPYNTCPQICVYCQRNWEIEEAMAPGALAAWDKIDEALSWIEKHRSIREVLVTGGDPLTLEDDQVKKIFDRLAENRNLDLIRIGSRIPVSVPMRVTDELAGYLGSLREPGRREVCLVTHVEHPYEITPEMVTAIDRLKRQGISVFNQQVYNFFVSRRFETARLRMLLRRIGIDPYYTFVTKGKQETSEYRVPIARLLQERKEEARLLPGLRRTDEVVYNVPRLGKNHIRAYQHRDLLSIAPNGDRIYEFHPWEKFIIQRDTYIGSDISILDYLNRLAAVGEDPEDYRSIWYYY